MSDNWKLQPQRSWKMIQRSVKEYGVELTDPRYELFAMAIANGATQAEAFKRIAPGCSDATARVQSSILTAHPNMYAMIGKRYMFVSVMSGAADDE